MSKVFVYGMSVEGDNFTDRKKETARLKLNFENGINTILISPRRMGKTSVVRKAIAGMAGNNDVMTVYMDIYDCRSEYDFYNKFAASVIQQTAGHVEQWIENARDFLSRLSPKISFSTDPMNEYSISLGITPATHKPEEILNLPEVIAREKNKSIVICIDEFQQIGEMTDSPSIQKRLRGVWQHQQNCSYCLFGSKKHLMTNLFQNRRMPFYLFGETMILERIPKDDWIDYIKKRFESRGKSISTALCERICDTTENYSSYVQQLAWNVFAETEETATEQNFTDGKDALIAQCSAFCRQTIQGLSTFQLNFMRAVLAGVHSGFGGKKIIEEYNLGSKSNVSRIQNTLIEKEIIEKRSEGLFFADPIFAIWFGRESNAGRHG
ncbi:MAG: ATP-binding protein [Bacteroidales bacterium]|nr:ATP-binding protein [Bacteroidales bacterium]MCM1147207.1 ATP-binding protein [Bacteroidales bacterium]MCM1205433.1 ATP-binding protein [Bacillota bacterium]MCM1509762.1 hypothetical protein [Clostridium sp.]